VYGGVLGDSVNALSANGLFYGGGFSQLGKQAVAAFSVMIYSFVIAYVLGMIIKKTIGFRVTTESEIEGIDDNEHAESAYDFTTLRSLGGGAGTPRPDAATPQAAEHIPAHASKES